MMKKKDWLFFLVASLLCIIATSKPLPAYHLKCDHNLVGTQARNKSSHFIHPFTTDNPHPRLSWSIRHTERDMAQIAYRVVVYEDNDIYWDTGVVNGSDQFVLYHGPSLKSGYTYEWKINWWDSKGRSVNSQETGRFLAVSITNEDWSKANWIAPPDVPHTAPIFSRNITLKAGANIETAILYISGLGFYRVYVNENDLFESFDPPIFLSPGWTNYQFRVAYSAYDILNILSKQLPNPLPIKVVLGMGWRDPISYPPRDPMTHPDKMPLVLRLILNITYSDGLVQLEYSDDTWEVQNSSYLYDSIYNGETLNEMIVPVDIGKAVITQGPSGVMYLPKIPYIAIQEVIPAHKMWLLPPDSSGHKKQIVDFGFNSAGIAKVGLTNFNARPLIVKHAEVILHPPYGEQDGSLYYGNLRSAKAIDNYTVGYDSKRDFYIPTFTYHGFRYAEITGFFLEVFFSEVYKICVNSDVKLNSKFNVSNPLFANIQENVLRGQLSNMMSVPTDCDQRDERLGWMGDGGLSSDSLNLNFHMETFFPNWVLLMRDEQTDEGTLPDVVPFYRYGNRPSGPAWGAAYPQVVWALYKYYGDFDTAKEFFDGLMLYLDFMMGKVSDEGLANLYSGPGDWCPPPPMTRVNGSFTSSFSFLLNIKQVQELATALHDTANATKLKDMYTKYASQFNDAFLSNGKYQDDLQVSYVLPLALDIVPPDQKDDIVKYFINKLTTSDKTHITCGIIGTKFLFPVLTSLNRNDLAVEILNQVDYPSYGFMIHNPYEPATTIWELWNAFNGSAGMDSRNHHMFSSISGWMQTDMIGFQQRQGTYGYNELDLYPASYLDLSSASIELEHPRPIKYSWHRKGGLQCGKAPEDQSSLNPTLPEHGGLKLSCGEGTIIKVQFASYGNPTGVCGYHRIGSCHVEQSLKVVETFCLNKTECILPTRGDFWGDPCFGETKWLTVAVLCSGSDNNHVDYRYSSLEVNVSIPIGSNGRLNLPAYGMSHIQVWDGSQLFYNGGHLMVEQKNIDVIGWNSEHDILQLQVKSGDYTFTVKGSPPDEVHTIETEQDTNYAYLTCSQGRVITSIDWVSYGNPVSSGLHATEYLLGSCHAGTSRMIVESTCLGKCDCKVNLNHDNFGGHPCPSVEMPQVGSPWKLIAKYSCNDRSF